MVGAGNSGGYTLYIMMFILDYQTTQYESLPFLPNLVSLLGIGVLQAVILRQYVYYAFLWIPVPILGFLVYAGFIVLSRQNDLPIVNIPTTIFSSLIIGSISGIVLVWLFKRTIPGKIASDDNPNALEEGVDESVI
jgi:hypothetical protein